MLIKIRKRIELLIILLILGNYTLSSHDRVITATYQDKPEEWWIGVLKKHKLDISQNHLKRFYSIGQTNFGYDNLLVVGDLPVIRAGVWSITECLLLVKISEEQYFIAKSKSADLNYNRKIFTYFNGTYQAFNFDKNPSPPKETQEITATTKFEFRSLDIDLNTNKIKAHTKSGTIKVL